MFGRRVCMSCFIVMITIAAFTVANADPPFPLVQVLVVEDFGSSTTVTLTEESFNEYGWAHVDDGEGGHIWVSVDPNASLNDIPLEERPDPNDSCHCNGSVWDEENQVYQDCEIWKDCDSKKTPCKVLINGIQCCYAPC